MNSFIINFTVYLSIIHDSAIITEGKRHACQKLSFTIGYFIRFSQGNYV